MKVFTLKIIRDLNRLVKQGKITSSYMVELMNDAVSSEMDSDFSKGKISGHDYLLRSVKELDKLEEIEDPDCEHYFPFGYDEKTDTMKYDNPCFFCGAESPYKNTR